MVCLVGRHVLYITSQEAQRRPQLLWWCAAEDLLCVSRPADLLCVALLALACTPAAGCRAAGSSLHLSASAAGRANGDDCNRCLLPKISRTRTVQFISMRDIWSELQAPGSPVLVW